MLLIIIILISFTLSLSPTSCVNTIPIKKVYEMKIYNYLIENNYKFCMQAKFPGLIKKTHPMMIDFYINDTGLAIEVDEAGHFPSGNSSTNIDQIMRDSKLNNYFLANNSPLLRIHWENIYNDVSYDLFKNDSINLHFSSDKYKFWIENRWTWDKHNFEYEYMNKQYNCKKEKLNSSISNKDHVGWISGWIFAGIISGISLSSLIILWNRKNNIKYTDYNELNDF